MLAREKYGERAYQLLNSWISAEENPAEYERVIRPVMDEVAARL